MVSQKARLVRIITACTIAVMVVSQLLTYETFVDVFVGAGVWDILVAAFIVVIEVAALPYLLSMDLSKLARMTSRVAGGLVVLVWAIVLATIPWGAPAGFLGTVVVLPSGLTAGGIVMLLVMMVVSVVYKGRR